MSTIRFATLHDIPAMAEIYESAYVDRIEANVLGITRAKPSLQQVKSKSMRLTQDIMNGAMSLIIPDQGFLMYSHDQQIGYIMHFYTRLSPEKYGQKLLDSFIDNMREKNISTISVYAENHAKPIYKHFGFIEQSPQSCYMNKTI